MTELDPGPAVQRVILGANLLTAREAASLTSSEATSALKWHAGKLTRVEQGVVPVRASDLEDCIRVYNIPSSEHRRLRDLAADGRRKLPPSRVPEWASRYVHLIQGAHELKLFYEASWPGTVQTADFARALLYRSITVASVDVDRMAEERVARVERLKSSGRPNLWLVVGQAALEIEIGGRETLRGQLELIRDLAELPNVEVQVIPKDGGAHAAHGVAFSLITLIEGSPGIVYLEGLTGSEYLGREHVRTYKLAFDNLMATALSPQGTMELINRRIKEL